MLTVVFHLKTKSKNMHFRYLLLALPLALSAMSVEEMAPRDQGMVKPRYIVTHNTEDFFIASEKGVRKVQPYDVDPLLRKMPKKKIKDFLKVGALEVKELSNGDYKLNAKVRGVGGGGWGVYFGAMGGKAVVHGTAVGVTMAAAALFPPASPAIWGYYFASLPEIEAASHVGALAGGIAVGVASGPV